jgi:hypothetical protein
MGLLLQILGVLALIASLVCSIIAIVNGTSKTTVILLLVAGASLIKIGRTIYNNTHKR